MWGMGVEGRQVGVCPAAVPGKSVQRMVPMTALRSLQKGDDGVGS